MKKNHALAVALLLGLAAALGVLAAGRTARLGAAAQAKPASVSVDARARQLSRVELQLQRALRNKPPALPPLPAAAPRTIATSAPRVVYRRPAPIVIVKHRSHHDDSGEREAQGQGGGDD